MKILLNIISACMLYLGLQAQAAEIEGIAHTGSNEVGKTHSIKLKLKSDSGGIYCGINIDWGDGQNQEYRVGKDFEIPPPYQVEHMYHESGTKKITLKGVALIRGLGSVGPCLGEFTDTINIIDPQKIQANKEKVLAERLANEKDERRRRDEAARLAIEEANAKIAEAEKLRLIMEKQLAEAKRESDEKDRLLKLTPEYKKAQQEAEKLRIAEAKITAERERRERFEAAAQAREEEKKRFAEEKAKVLKEKKDREDLEKEQAQKEVRDRIESSLLRPLMVNADPRLACQSKWAFDSRFTSFSQKTSIFGVTDFSFQMLSDASSPSSKEQQIIAQWADEYKKCVQESAQFRTSNYPKEAISILEKEDNDFINSAMDLYGKKLTFGNYNKRVQEIFRDSRKNLEALQQLMIAKRQEQEEEARARAAALKDAQVRQEQQRRAQDQQRQDERRRQDQLRQQETARIHGIRRQWAARCEFDRRNAYEKFKKTKENDCKGNSAGLVFLCVVGVDNQATDYGKAAFDSCMSGAPN